MAGRSETSTAPQGTAPAPASAAARYAGYSFWLETCGEDLTPRPSLDGSTDVDVAILGAGFTGLWTAYYLLKRQPTLRVIVLEKEIAGYGASGRNGGWCSSKLNVPIDTMARRYGRERAQALQQALYATVDEIGRVCAAEAIGADYVRSGALFVTRFPYQQQAMDELAATYEQYGFADNYQVLSASALEQLIRVRGALGGFQSHAYAHVHPGKLVRGLARAVERLGGRIHEQTEVTSFRPGRPAVVTTPRGEVRAGVIVLAGEAYLTRLRELHRALLPVYSLIVLTEPLSAAQWEAIGWRQRECVASFRLSIDYLARTPDGRVLFGGRGAPYRFGSAIADAYDRDEATHAMLRHLVRDWFPVLGTIRFTHAWGGPLGMPRDWSPTISCDRTRGIATARGYTGHGVAASNLAGRTLADLVLERRTALTGLPIVNHRSPDWEPEPLRWVAVRYVQRALAHLDTRAELTGRAPTGRSLAERLSRP